MVHDPGELLVETAFQTSGFVQAGATSRNPFSKTTSGAIDVFVNPLYAKLRLRRYLDDTSS